MSMGESCITVPMAANDKAKIALSSFVRALYELESYAVARIVTKAGKAPEMLLLAPSVEQNLEALIDVPLPFAEDVRVYRFPPLDRVITTSGATLTKHRSLPSDELDAAMSAYVDSMDLSTFEKDEDGHVYLILCIIYFANAAQGTSRVHGHRGHLLAHGTSS